MAKATARLGKATFVAKGYGQVEPNMLTAGYTGQVFAQLPADKDIDLLENGQFVRYNYAAGVCNFGSATATAADGPWMMVFNEIKVYKDREGDADFAMVKDNYVAHVYSPVGQHTSALKATADGDMTAEGTNSAYTRNVETFTYPEMMPEGTKMVPRVIKVNVGDIWTTNTIMATAGSLAVGDTLKIGDDGYLTKGTGKGGDADPIFAVVKVYTMPDMQPGVKLQRVA